MDPEHCMQVSLKIFFRTFSRIPREKTYCHNTILSWLFLRRNLKPLNIFNLSWNDYSAWRIRIPKKLKYQEHCLFIWRIYNFIELPFYGCMEPWYIISQISPSPYIDSHQLSGVFSRFCSSWFSFQKIISSPFLGGFSLRELGTIKSIEEPERFPNRACKHILQ